MLPTRLRNRAPRGRCLSTPTPFVSAPSDQPGSPSSHFLSAAGARRPATEDDRAGRLSIELLVVEDDAVDREQVRRVLPDGCECRFAADGSAAIAAIRDRRPDVVLLDYHLPATDTEDLIRRLAKRGLSIVLMTGRGDREVLEEAATAGIDDFLAKDELTRQMLYRSLRLASERGRRREIQSQFEIAAEVQWQLAHEGPPEIPGFAVSASLRPASQAGGDFYKAMTLRSGRRAIVVGDVTGHDLGSMLTMVAIRGQLALGARFCDTLAPVLREIDALLATRADAVAGERFATAVGLEIDAATGSLSYVGAGHDLYLLKADDRTVQTLPSTTRPLSMIAEGFFDGRGAAIEQLVPHPVPIAAGDQIVVCTDGVTDVCGRDGAGGTDDSHKAFQPEYFGRDRLLGALESCVGWRAEETRRRIQRAIDEFGGSAPRPDDQTILVLEVLTA